MGQCQSYPSSDVIHGQMKENENVQLAKNASRRRFLPPRLVKGRPGNANEKPKLTIIVTPDGAETISDPPLTGKTAAETPMSVASPLNMSIGSSDASSCPSRDEESVEVHEDDNEEEQEVELHQATKTGGLSLSHFFQSLRHTEELDPVIPEEIDPDAPSDEEEERMQQEQEIARKLPPAKTTKPKAGVSPPRPQDRIKMQHRRITHPSSVINRDVPESAAPVAVSSQHLSEFRKLKVQVKLAARQERKKARIAKLEDRYEDVRGYNNLWQNFEEIRSTAETMPPKLKRSNSFDLHNSGTWFFDFQSFDEEDASCYDFDDEMSQSSLSLHSTTSMESQRRYFKEKQEGRLRRRTNSDTNLFLMNQIIHTKMQKPVEETSLSRPKYTPNHATVSTPPSILRGARKNDPATPVVSELGTPESRGPVAPRVNAFQIATGQPEYHVYNRLGEKPVDHDEDTPKAKSRRKTAPCEPQEEDMNNDYQVARRRRVASYNDADISILTDERATAESLGIHLPPSPDKRDFDYSSFAIEVITTDRPSVRVMRMSPKEKENMNRKEKVVSGNAAKCLEETFAGGKKKRKQVDSESYKYSEPPTPTIYNMSTQDFLRFSDSHALVNVTNNHSHELHLESSSFATQDDKEDTSACEGFADDVNQQIDALLRKYRQDNENEVVRHDIAYEGVEQQDDAFENSIERES